jgi:nifR3 family TIM-barrel protein
LLRQPAAIGELVRALVEAVAVPVTAKIRLGWDEDSLNYREVTTILQEAGVAAIAVHGRTRAQGYSGSADWDAIAEINAMATVPVLANGDVRTVADVDAIKAVTGCTGVLIGRGAIGNPWIFQRRDLDDVSLDERLAMIERHVRAMVAWYGADRGVILFRKHALKYVRGLKGAAALRARLVKPVTVEGLLEMIHDWREENGLA